jgi:thiamine-phosphate pyrophosphorylase
VSFPTRSQPNPGFAAVKPLSECRLYAFVDTAYLRGRKPETIAQQLCDGGADLIQLRAKNSSVGQIRQMAEAILPITRRGGVGLVINDHPQIAHAIGAEFCHLGQEDFFDDGHTHISQVIPAGEPLKVGLSTHAPDQAKRAIAAGASYVAAGPVFATGTKPDVKPVGLDYIRWVNEHINIPWFAIGGITLANLEAVCSAGARRICVVSAILDALDVAATCRQFKERVGLSR